MLSLAIWWTTLVLEIALLLRGLRGELHRKFRLFYVYMSCVFFQSFFLLIIYFVRPRYYKPFYWYAEFVSVVLGCGVVWGIYRRTLCPFPGAARMARNVVFFVLIVVFSRVLANSWDATVWWPSGTVIALERDFRAVQAVLLIGLVVVIAFYRIPVGWNLWGMMLGYGLFIGTNVIILAVRVLVGDSFQTPWKYLQPLSYLAVLCIWCVTLWSYRAVPVPETEPRIEQDYQLLTLTTRKGLLHARAYLGKVMRP